MAEKLTVARPYARALFAEAQAQNKLDAWQLVLQALAMIAVGLTSQGVNDDPQVSDEQLENLVADVLEQTVSVDAVIKEDVVNLIHLLVLEKRLDVVPEILTLFHDMVMAAQNQKEVEVYAPTPLTEAQQQDLIKALEKRFNATIEMVYHEDKTLIGGMVVRAGSWVMDGSVKGKLTRLAESLI